MKQICANCGNPVEFVLNIRSTPERVKPEYFSMCCSAPLKDTTRMIKRMNKSLNREFKEALERSYEIVRILGEVRNGKI